MDVSITSERRIDLFNHNDFILSAIKEAKEMVEMTGKLIKDVRADILQVSVASPFSGIESYERCKVDGYLLTDDPDGCLDYEGHQKAAMSYPGLANEEMVKEVDNILKGYYMSFGYVPLAVRQVLRRLWYSMRMFLGYIVGR